MREYFTYGSVRGVVGNDGPYRVPICDPKLFCFPGSEATAIYPHPSLEQGSTAIRYQV
ncbi:MAG: hypothetical protein ACI9HK_000162 [Pirellulaceae bacterium]|jgi:hypothetical protein